MNEIYHVLSRGVDKRKIFMDNKDYYRFIHDLFEFNDEKPATNFSYYCKRYPLKPVTSDVDTKISTSEVGRPRDLLVDIHAFCLMPNHYHILLSAKKEKAITKFMRKLNIGYVKYFNEKHERSGALFESRYKSVLVEKNSHFLYLPFYIHFNPLDMVCPEWRENKLNNFDKAVKFLNNYKWSSHLDYKQQKNFPSVIQKDFLTEVFGGEEKYDLYFKQRLKDLKSLNLENKLILE